MRKAQGITHMQALNQIAQRYGFKIWTEYLASKDIKE